MSKKEAKTCWAYWSCDPRIMQKCYAFLYGTGIRCWELAGTGCKDPYCFLLKKAYRYCWECPWFKKVNPGFFKQ